MTDRSVSSPAARPRLAYVTAGFPFPLWSGYLRHHFLLAELAVTHDITLLSLVGGSFEPEHRAGIVGVSHIETFARRGGQVPRLVELTSGGSRPVGAVRELCRTVETMIRRDEVDAVFLSGKDTAAVAPMVAAHGVPLVVDLCDATSDRLAQQLADADPIGRVSGRVRRTRMVRLERCLIEAADRAFVASDRDRRALVATHGPQVSALAEARTVPNGIDGAYWSRVSPHLGSAVAFCGNLAYPPNADAASRLVRSIMPLVWADHPDAEVVLIGRGAGPDLLGMAVDPRVELTGTVPDVRPHLERAAVFAAPLRAASGIQNKVLEALAMQVPVIATTGAAAGLNRAGSPPPVVVGDEDAELASAISTALDAARRDPRPDRAAGAWVREHFVWERSAETVASSIAEARALRSGSTSVVA